MRFAAIPPVPNLDDFESTGMHLCLAQLINDERYVAHYKQRSEQGDYIILDNGAHENQSFDFAEMLAMARGIGAKEVVIQDAPHDAVQTLTYFHDIMALIEFDYSIQRLIKSCGVERFMFVPQVPLVGDSFTRFIDIASFMIKRALTFKNTDVWFTVGVPLMYEKVSGGLYSILDRITWFVEDTEIDIHLLGWSRDLSSPIDIAHDYPGVRSCDSAKPFVFAQNQIRMFDAISRNEHHYPGRSNTYFTDKMSDQEVQLARINVDFCVQSLATGNLPGMSQSYGPLSTSSRPETSSDRS